jgi:hypothetical protein
MINCPQERRFLVNCAQFWDDQVFAFEETRQPAAFASRESRTLGSAISGRSAKPVPPKAEPAQPGTEKNELRRHGPFSFLFLSEPIACARHQFMHGRVKCLRAAEFAWR